MDVPKKLLKNLRLGTYKLIILSIALREGKVYGYKIRKEIREASNGLLTPSESTIYVALKGLSKLGLLKGHWEESERGGMIKFYEVPEGRRKEAIQILKMAEEELEMYLKIIKRGEKR